MLPVFNLFHPASEEGWQAVATLEQVVYHQVRVGGGLLPLMLQFRCTLLFAEIIMAFSLMRSFLMDGFT